MKNFLTTLFKLGLSISGMYTTKYILCKAVDAPLDEDAEEDDTPAFVLKVLTVYTGISAISAYVYVKLLRLFFDVE